MRHEHQVIREAAAQGQQARELRAAETDRMMKDLVTEALRRYLGVKEGGESKKS